MFSSEDCWKILNGSFKLRVRRDFDSRFFKGRKLLCHSPLNHCRFCLNNYRAVKCLKYILTNWYGDAFCYLDPWTWLALINFTIARSIMQTIALHSTPDIIFKQKNNWMFIYKDNLVVCSHSLLSLTWSTYKMWELLHHCFGPANWDLVVTVIL